MPDQHTATLRRFNRTYTQRIGALDESFLGTGFPLGASRLLFEIGPGGATVRDLRARLDLDSGYLTRLLRPTRPTPGWSRSHPTRPTGGGGWSALTAAGRRTWRELDDRSEALARSIVEPLTERQRRPADRGAGDRRPAGAGGHDPPARGRPDRPGGARGRGAVLRRARPTLPARVRPGRARTTPAPSWSRPATAGRWRTAGCSALSPEHRGGQADVGARRLARRRARLPDAARSSRRWPPGSATPASCSTPTAR